MSKIIHNSRLVKNEPTNLQAINTELLRDKMDKHERLRKLNEIAIYQLQILTSLPTLKKLPNAEK